MTYNKYNFYLSMLLITSENFYERINPSKFAWYESLSDEDKSNVTMFDIITNEPELQTLYCDIFNFFFEENFIWDNNIRMYIACKESSADENKTPDKNETPDENETPEVIGIIHKNIFYDLLDIILQRCGVEKKDSADRPKFKNKMAERIWLKTQNSQKEKETTNNTNMELPNLISAYAAFGNGVNITSVWDMTVFQLYDQFQRQRVISYHNLSSMSVATWGDKDNKFDIEGWYKSIY